MQATCLLISPHGRAIPMQMGFDLVICKTAVLGRLQLLHKHARSEHYMRNVSRRLSLSNDNLECPVRCVTGLGIPGNWIVPAWPFVISG